MIILFREAKYTKFFYWYLGGMKRSDGTYPVHHQGFDVFLCVAVLLSKNPNLGELGVDRQSNIIFEVIDPLIEILSVSI